MTPELQLLAKLKCKARATVNWTPNTDCPACADQLRHSPEEWKQYHPLAGTGRGQNQ